MALRRELSLLSVFCIASGAMISSGLFILPGLAYARAGPAVIISYFLAGLLALPGMLSIAEMTTAMPKAGGDCFAVIRSMGPAVGTVAGLLSWFSLSMKSAFALVGMSIFTVLIVDVNIHIIATGFCLLFLFINLIGIKEAGKTQVALVVGLLALMALYILVGLPNVDVKHFSPFVPRGPVSVFWTTGFVFVSYAGLLKIASIAEEIKNPMRNIPLGMLLSHVIVSILYTFMVFVTVGVLKAEDLSGTLTPISDGAEVFLGRWGQVAMAAAAILAFLSTANAGLMTSARSLVPLSQDGLLPGMFGKINKRFGTPHTSLIFTGCFIIAALFLKLEILVEAASIVLILTNVLACISLIVLRESHIQNYKPKFRTPFYPWLQIGGITGFIFIIFEMGKEALAVSFILIIGGFLVYLFYGRIRTDREYALLHLIERITARELTTYTLETELKEIIRERDQITKDRFDTIIENCVVLDIDKAVTGKQFFEMAARALSGRLKMDSAEVAGLLLERESQSSTVISEHLAIPHIVIGGKQIFDILLARCKEGIIFSEPASPPASRGGKEKQVNAAFVIIGTKDERNFHLHSLAAIAQIVQGADFEQNWIRAQNIEVLRDIILLGKRKRL